MSKAGKRPGGEDNAPFADLSHSSSSRGLLNASAGSSAGAVNPLDIELSFSARQAYSDEDDNGPGEAPAGALPPAADPAPQPQVPVSVAPPFLFDNPSCADPDAPADRPAGDIALRLNYPYPEASAPPPLSSYTVSSRGGSLRGADPISTGASPRLADAAAAAAPPPPDRVHSRNAACIGALLLMCMLVMSGVGMAYLTLRAQDEIDGLSRELDMLKLQQKGDVDRLEGRLKAMEMPRPAAPAGGAADLAAVEQKLSVRIDMVVEAVAAVNVSAAAGLAELREGAKAVKEDVADLRGVVVGATSHEAADGLLEATRAVEDKLANATKALDVATIGVAMLRARADGAHAEVEDALKHANYTYIDAAGFFEDAKATVRAAADAVDAQIASYQDAHAALEALRAGVAAEQDALGNITAQVEGVAGELDTAVDEAQARIAGVRREAAGLRNATDALARHRQSVRDLGDRILIASVAIEDVEEQVNTTLGPAVDDLQTLRDAHEEIADLHHVLAANAHTVAALNASVGQTVDELAAIEASLNASVLASMAAAEADTAKLRAAVAVLNRTLAGYETEARAFAEVSHAALNGLNATLVGQVAAAQAEFTEVWSAIDSTAAQKPTFGWAADAPAELVGRIDVLNASVMTSEHRLDALENATSSLEGTREQGKKREAFVRASLDALFQKLVFVNGSIDALLSDAAEAGVAARALAGDVRGNAAAIMALEGSAAALNASLVVVEEDMAAGLRAVNDTLLGELDAHVETRRKEIDAAVQGVADDVARSLNDSLAAVGGDIASLKAGGVGTDEVLQYVMHQRTALALLNATVVGVMDNVDGLAGDVAGAKLEVVAVREGLAGLNYTTKRRGEEAGREVAQLRRDVDREVEYVGARLERGLGRARNETAALGDRITRVDAEREAGDRYSVDRIDELDRAAGAVLYQLARSVTTLHDRALNEVSKEATLRQNAVDRLHQATDAALATTARELRGEMHTMGHEVTQRFQAGDAALAERLDAVETEQRGEKTALDDLKDTLDGLKRKVARFWNIVR
eukprot:TRINITY_DN2349_c0_g1_i2.p1 TRINITY_DN2349_c0_g1~~TRINITY_DN2349_c0_g1_i2.p1  ORF type:complete len:1040 (+),score=352.70 TRINITY_DN2349_c0_g1_i2:57-3176(+)